MGLDVVGVAVAAELVVGDEHLGPHFADDLHEVVGCLAHVGQPERVGPDVGGDRGHPRLGPPHAGVAVVAGPTQEAVVGDAQLGHGIGELTDAVPAEPVVAMGGEMLEIGDEDLALLAQRARDQRDLGPFGGVARHGGAVGDGLVVGMGVDEHQAPVRTCFCHARQPRTKARHATSPGVVIVHQGPAPGERSARVVNVINGSVVVTVPTWRQCLTTTSSRIAA